MEVISKDKPKGKAYSINGSNYKDRDSLDYFGRVKGKHRMHENTEKLLEELLTMLSEKGEEETFAYIRKLRKIKK